MDIRHPCQAFDEQMLDWAGASELPIRVLLNKADKLSFGAQKQTLSRLQQRYAKHSTASFQTFSAARGEGKAALIEHLLDWLRIPLEDPAAPQSKEPEG